MTADMGLTWTDGDVTLRKPADMAETQWVTVRDAFITYCEAEGLQRTGRTCPWWCNRVDALHIRGESEAGGNTVLLIHTHSYGEDALAVVQDEVTEHGVTRWERPEIHVYGAEPETAVESRQIAGWFLEAADLLERITL